MMWTKKEADILDDYVMALIRSDYIEASRIEKKFYREVAKSKPTKRVREKKIKYIEDLLNLKKEI